MGDRRGAPRVEIIELIADDRPATRPTVPIPRAGGPRPATVAIIVIVALVLGGVVVRSLVGGHSHPAARVPATTLPSRGGLAPTPTSVEEVAQPVVTVPTGGVCSDDRVPFRTTFLPKGWTTEGAAWSGPDLLTGSSGSIHAMHGPAIPYRGDPVSSLTVLGVPASLAPMGNGHSVEFVLGAPSDLCDHWALIATKGVSAATLQRIAEGLTAFSSASVTLECRQAYPVPTVDLAGRTLVLDAVALPSALQLDTVPAHLANGTLALFARESLAVRAGASFTLTVSPASAGRVAMDWQSRGDTMSSVTVPECAARTPWLTYFGGFWVLEPQCATLLVDVRGQQQEVRVGIGTTCP